MNVCDVLLCSKSLCTTAEEIFHAPNITQNTKWNNYEDTNTKERNKK
jgi:hypothetical protein